MVGRSVVSGPLGPGFSSENERFHANDASREFTRGQAPAARRRRIRDAPSGPAGVATDWASSGIAVRATRT